MVSWSGHVAHPEASGKLSLRRSRSAAGASGDAWRTRTTSGKMVLGSALGTGGKFGKHSEGGLEVYRIGSRLELRDACQLPKGLRKGGVLRAGF